MSTSSLIKVSACGAAAVIAVAGFTAPSQAQQNGKNAPTETGCYNIVDGSATLVRNNKITFLEGSNLVQHGPDAENLSAHTHGGTYKTYTREPTSDADARLDVILDNAAGADCSGVRYRLRILDESRRLVADMVVPGSTSDTVSWRTTFAYPAGGAVRLAYFSATTETAGGRVVDTAPDDPDGAVVELSGAPASSSFR
jgi:hypothetical protein